jgi:hypothetical protein
MWTGMDQDGWGEERRDEEEQMTPYMNCKLRWSRIQNIIRDVCLKISFRSHIFVDDGTCRRVNRTEMGFRVYGFRMEKGILLIHVGLWRVWPYPLRSEWQSDLPRTLLSGFSSLRSASLLFSILLRWIYSSWVWSRWISEPLLKDAWFISSAILCNSLRNWVPPCLF